MVAFDIKGLHRVKAKGRVYHYAWRGGPRLKGALGSPEFLASYSEAVASRQAPNTGRFAGLIVAYKASADYKKLANSTKRNWGSWLDRINRHFGELSTAQFDRSEKIRPFIRQWRGTFAKTPRAADYGMQVLSRVCSYAVDPLGKLASNPCEGIKRIYSNTRADIIWAEDDVATLKAVCSKEVGLAVDLAAHTGLRVGDLIRLSWSHVGEDAIIITTGKSGDARREAVIPLYSELRNLLARIPRHSPVILTNSRRRPWTGLNSSFDAAMKKAWPDGRDLHFHDLRGTAATKFYNASLTERQIAEIMGWEEEKVTRIIRRYVSRTASLKELIRQIDQAKK